MSSVSDVVRTAGTFITAWIVMVGGFIFLDRLIKNLADPNLAAVDAGTLGIIVGGIMGVLTLTAQAIFQAEVGRISGRQSRDATAAGVNAALTQPPGQTVTVDAGPPAKATVTPNEPPPADPSAGQG
jgi:hypothetical protein